MKRPRLRSMDNRYGLSALHQDGHEIPVDVGLTHLDLDDRRLVVAVIRDLRRRFKEEAELRKSREQLRSLSTRLLVMREQERSRISRRLHDQLGQMLTGIKMDLAWVQRRLEVGQRSLVDRCRATSASIDATIQVMRQIATELRPGILDEIGLEAAVEWQLEEFGRRTDINYLLVSDFKQTKLDHKAATVAFRVLQEGLTNVAQHAHADHVEVTLSGIADELRLTVRDNGRGITKAELEDPKSIGLLGMHERARSQGGLLEIRGASGHGTTLVLRLPLLAARSLMP